MTLALLITAASGAWAEESETINTATNGKTVYTGTHFKITASLDCDGDGILLWDGSNSGTATIEALNGENITKIEMHMSYGGYWATSTTTTAGKLVATNSDLNANDISVTDINATSVTIGTSQNGQGWIQINKFVIYYGAAASSDVEVTTNAEEGETTFTEASFAMPAFDATADYELVRDMSIQMTAQVGDGTQEQPRYRVKKDGNNKFIPADMEITAVPALFTVIDGIENNKVLTQTQDYTVQIYPVDEQTGQPTGEAMTFATFTFEPGIYAVKAVAAQGSDYDGETAFSNTFKLFQGYEVQVAAGEYITYYKDEALYVENENAKLYTIASITESETVLSSEISVAPALTPLLVFNSSDEAKTFLLIPTTDKTPDNVTAATQFVGTLEATTIPASTTGADNYALNGYAFVWVKTAIEVGANKCWLHIASQPAGARGNTRSITGGNGTTGIESIHNSTIDNEGWYDLNGRKLQSAPNRKGIYIHNGKKVVMK